MARDCRVDRAWPDRAREGRGMHPRTAEFISHVPGTRYLEFKGIHIKMTLPKRLGQRVAFILYNYDEAITGLKNSFTVVLRLTANSM